MDTNNDFTKAMILAGGKGTRLMPLTSMTPKVLLPIGGVPLIKYQISWLKRNGISDIAINLHHLGNKITNYLGDGSRFGVRIAYSYEYTLLGTAGAVKRMEGFFDGGFIVVYGDILTDFNLSQMVSFHRVKGSLATLAVFSVSNPWEVGVVQIEEDGRITSFVEKPDCGSTVSNLGSGGIYIMEKEVLKYIPCESSSDFAYDIFPKLLENGRRIYGYMLTSEDYLIDIGTIEKYAKAENDVNQKKVNIKAY